jgi:hypothetical protein
MDSTAPSKDTNWQTGFKNENPTICCLQVTHLINRKKHWLKVKGCEKIYQGNVLQ